MGSRVLCIFCNVVGTLRDQPNSGQVHASLASAVVLRPSGHSVHRLQVLPFFEILTYSLGSGIVTLICPQVPHHPFT